MSRKKTWGSFKESFKKHYKWYVAAVLLILVLGAGAYHLRLSSLEKAGAGQIQDLPREGREVENNFYSRQLTMEENENFLYMKERMESLSGGVVTLPNPVNGKEYERIQMALESEGYNYFYGLYEIPMTEDNVYVMHKKTDYEKITEKKIAKVILFLSCAQGLDLQGDYAEDGTVRNIDEIDQKLSVNIPEKEDEIRRIQQETENVLDQIMAGLPADAGEKSTVDYFLNWMDENILFDQEIAAAANSISNMEEMLDHIYKYNHIMMVTEGRSLALGYAKVLSELCTRAGMESHIVMGRWKAGILSSESYVFTAVRMNDSVIYVDASGAKGNNMADHRYLRADEAANHMEFLPYFDYKE